MRWSLTAPKVHFAELEEVRLLGFSDMQGLFLSRAIRRSRDLALNRLEQESRGSSDRVKEGLLTKYV